MSVQDLNGLVRKGEPGGNVRVVLPSQAYTSLFKLAVDRLPSETIGVLIGETLLLDTEGGNQNWITIRDAVPLTLVSTPHGLGVDRAAWQGLYNRLSNSYNEGYDTLQVVGWFYAAPGVGMLSPIVSFDDLTQAIGFQANLLLLVNPLTNEGAFYSVYDDGWEPVGGFYEVVSDEGQRKGRRAKSKGSSDIIPWHSEVKNATEWLDTLVGCSAAPDPAEPEDTSAQTSTLPVADTNANAPLDSEPGANAPLDSEPGANAPLDSEPGREPIGTESPPEYRDNRPEQETQYGSPTVALPLTTQRMPGPARWVAAEEVGPAPSRVTISLIWKVALACLALVLLVALVMNIASGGSSGLPAESSGPTITPLSQSDVPTAPTAVGVLPGGMPQSTGVLETAITGTPSATPSPTSIRATATATAVPPSATATPGTPFVPTVVTGSHEFRFEEGDFTGGYRPSGDLYRGRTARLLYATRTQESTITVKFNLNLQAGGPIDGADLVLTGMDSADAVKASVRITLNNVVVFEGADPLANELLNTPADSANWTTHTWRVPGSAFRQGANTLTITNLSASVRGSTQPFVVFDYASISW